MIDQLEDIQQRNEIVLQQVDSFNVKMKEMKETIENTLKNEYLTNKEFNQNKLHQFGEIIMKYCNKCGLEFEEDVFFCPNCGVKCQEVCAKENSGEAMKETYVRPKWHIVMSFIANVLVAFSVFFIMLFAFTRLFGYRGITIQNLETYTNVSIIFASFHFALGVVIMILYLSLIKKNKFERAFNQIFRVFIALLLIIFAIAINNLF